MEQRVQQLTKRIEFCRELLRGGVPSEEATRLLTLIIELEEEIARQAKEKPRD